MLSWQKISVTNLSWLRFSRKVSSIWYISHLSMAQRSFDTPKEHFFVLYISFCSEYCVIIFYKPQQILSTPHPILINSNFLQGQELIIADILCWDHPKQIFTYYEIFTLFWAHTLMQGKHKNHQNKSIIIVMSQKLHYIIITNN